MPKKYAVTEKSIEDIFKVGEKFIYENIEYTIDCVGKPASSAGEPKTDVYISGLSGDSQKKELKISIKQTNADFLENKISEERARQLFGENWSQYTKTLVESIRDKFSNTKLIFKQRKHQTDKGCFTLGWKFEFTNKSGGELSGKLNDTLDANLVQEVLKEALSGEKLNDSKRNAKINKVVVPDSGVANYMLTVDSTKKVFTTKENVIERLKTIDEYVEINSDIYFACKALNYRTIDRNTEEVISKWDGNRPLSVNVKWKITNGKLDYDISYENPLSTKGNSVACSLMCSLNDLDISTSDDINSDTLVNTNIIYNP